MRPIRTVLACLAMALVVGNVAAQPSKPRVAILVYDGVQVIDHAIPYEVFGQFSLNEVYTVAKEPGPITTYMGMRVLPNHAFASAPPPDVLVLPGGDAGEAADDPEIVAWVRETAAAADHVLTICTGTFFLVGTDLLDGARVTTWYDRQDDLRRAVPTARVIGDSIVVDDGKLVSAAGSGIEGALHVLARLHGPAWAEVVRLNMEYEPMPHREHVPRVELADLNLPDGIYGAFPWREADMTRYDGDRDAWAMAWRFRSDTPLDSLRERFSRALTDRDGWSHQGEERSEGRWVGTWSLEGRDGGVWRGVTALVAIDRGYDLRIRVRRGTEPCESVDPAWSPDGRLLFVSRCEGNAEIYRMGPDGSGVERLTDTPGAEHEPVYSPDGRRVAYAYHPEGEDSEIRLMDADGGNVRTLTDDEWPEWSPTFSPDGGRIAYESTREENGDVWVRDLESGREDRLTDHPTADLAPAWSPDGATIAFQTNRDGRYSIYGIGPDGGEAVALAVPAGHAVAPTWSSNGKRLAFTRAVDGEEDIWIAAVDGSSLARVTTGDRTDFAPAWSPLGDRIAFIAREEGGAWDVWTIAPDGSDPVRLTFGGEPGGPEPATE